MYSPVHATAGILLAHYAPNAPVAFAIGVVSHYILDAVPHGDTRPLAVFQRMSKSKLLLMTEPFDLGLMILLTWWIARGIDQPAVKLWSGAIGAITPDLLWGSKVMLERLGWNIPGLTQFLQWHNVWHERFHVKTSHDIRHAIGITYQLVLIAGLFFLFR